MRRSEKLSLSDAVFMKYSHALNQPSSICIGQIQFSQGNICRAAQTMPFRDRDMVGCRSQSCVTRQHRPADEKPVKGHHGKFLGPEILARGKGKLQRLQCGCTRKAQHRNIAQKDFQVPCPQNEAWRMLICRAAGLIPFTVRDS